MSRRILCVDDERLIREALRLFLESISLQVDCVGSGRECVEHFRSAPDDYAMVVVNYDMPEMGGPEVIEELRRINAETPMALSSAFSKDEVLRQVPDTIPFLRKPYTRSQFRKFFRRHLRTDELQVACLRNTNAATAECLQALSDAGVSVTLCDRIEELGDLVRRDFIKISVWDLSDGRVRPEYYEAQYEQGIPLLFLNIPPELEESVSAYGATADVDAPLEELLDRLRRALELDLDSDTAK